MGLSENRLPTAFQWITIIFPLRKPSWDHLRVYYIYIYIEDIYAIYRDMYT